VRIAAVQHDISWADPQANLTRLAPMLAQAAGQGADLALLSELFPTGFVTDRADVAEPVGGRCSSFLCEQAQTLGIWVGGSLAELGEDGDPRPYNTFVLAGPDGSQHRYRKVHRFTYGGEHRHFRAGSELLTVTVQGLRVGLRICYDLRFAPDFWDHAADTDVFLVPANWPDSRALHWRTLLRARAIENQAYVVGCNRVGSGGGLTYAGDSAVIDPLGEALAQAGDGESIVLAEVSAAHVAAVRERFPFLTDRSTSQIPSQIPSQVES
jgi:predicted amidohydrolase